MYTSTKRNEHPRCSCRMCKLGAASNAGQFEHQRVNRKIRRKSKAALRSLLDASLAELEAANGLPVVVPTGYTD